MVRHKSVPTRVLDERRFRFRVRFERPPGGGIWNSNDLFRWLDEQLGKNNYGFHPDFWEGHGTETYALHLDDHTIIPELLERFAALRTLSQQTPVFRAALPVDQARQVRQAVTVLQAEITKKLNNPHTRVTWAMGKCEFLRDMPITLGDRLSVSRVNALTEVDALLSAIPAGGETVQIQLQDYQRASVELGRVFLMDQKISSFGDTIVALRNLLDALMEIK